MSTCPEQFQNAETIAVREGLERTPYGEHSEPIFTTSSFVFASAAEAAARFAGTEDGFIYSRFSNPTVAQFECRLAALEKTEACIATSSGMAAVMLTVLATLRHGDHIVASRSMFGSTVSLFDKVLPRMGIEVSWVSLADTKAWAAMCTTSTKMFFVETPTNPLTELADIAALADIAHSRNILLAVDNCFCTPALQRPATLGADLVIHSATKYIDGQGRCIGGAVAGPAALLEDSFLPMMRSTGPSMSPFNAWVFSKGLETLPLRMQRHCESAMRLAQWLEEQSAVDRVYYPGLEYHPQHALAQRQQSGFGGVVSFEVSGGQSAAWKLIDEVQMLSITANLGDAKTTITHPSTTTHGRLSDQDREQAGIKPGLVRVAVGLEHVDDIVLDLEQALRRCQ